MSIIFATSCSCLLLLFSFFLFNSENNWQSWFCWVIKEVWLGLCCWSLSILTPFKAKCIKIDTLFKMLNSGIEYFFKIEDTEWAKHGIFPPLSTCVHLWTPKGTFFHISRHRNNEYCQDSMNNISVACLMYLPIFQAVFQNIHKSTCQPKFSCWRTVSLQYHSEVILNNFYWYFHWF